MNLNKWKKLPNRKKNWLAHCNIGSYTFSIVPQNGFTFLISADLNPSCRGCTKGKTVAALTRWKWESETCSRRGRLDSSESWSVWDGPGWNCCSYPVLLSWGLIYRREKLLKYTFSIQEIYLVFLLEPFQIYRRCNLVKLLLNSKVDKYL